MKKILKYVGIVLAVLNVIAIGLSDDTEQQTTEQAETKVEKEKIEVNKEVKPSFDMTANEFGEKFTKLTNEFGIVQAVMWKKVENEEFTKEYVGDVTLHGIPNQNGKLEKVRFHLEPPLTPEKSLVFFSHVATLALVFNPELKKEDTSKLVLTTLQGAVEEYTATQKTSKKEGVIGQTKYEAVVNADGMDFIFTKAKQQAEIKNVENKSKLTDEQKAKIVEYFKSDKEPSIVDALFPYDTLKLGVHNDGTNRDGLADYACQILVNDFNVKELVVVKIIDIDKLVKTDKWETIGEKNCNY